MQCKLLIQMNESEHITSLRWIEKSLTQLSVGMFLELAQLADSLYNVFYLLQSSCIDEAKEKRT